jgi:arylformamidase
VSRFIELSHTIVPGMKTYPGLPEPKVEIFLDYETSRERFQNKAEFLIASLHLCGNTGTYVDAPIHRHRNGKDLADLPLEQLADLKIEVFDASRAGRAIGKDNIDGRELRGRAVLFRTDFSLSFGTERYFRDNPFLTAELCAELVARGAAFVGIDSLNIDDVGDLSRPAHTTLLGAGIPVCEHLTNLAALPSATNARLHAVPIAWRGGTTFPVRAYAVIDSAALRRRNSRSRSPASRGTRTRRCSFGRNTLRRRRSRGRCANRSW